MTSGSFKQDSEENIPAVCAALSVQQGGQFPLCSWDWRISQANTGQVLSKRAQTVILSPVA